MSFRYEYCKRLHFLIALSRRVWARKPTVEEEMASLAIKSESPEVSLTPAVVS